MCQQAALHTCYKCVKLRRKGNTIGRRKKELGRETNKDSECWATKKCYEDKALGLGCFY